MQIGVRSLPEALLSPENNVADEVVVRRVDCQVDDDKTMTRDVLIIKISVYRERTRHRRRE